VVEKARRTEMLFPCAALLSIFCCHFIDLSLNFNLMDSIYIDQDIEKMPAWHLLVNAPGMQQGELE
jgi:hypothetical protein